MKLNSENLAQFEKSFKYLSENYYSENNFRRVFTAKQIDKLIEMGRIEKKTILNADSSTNWQLKEQTVYKWINAAG